MARFSRTALGVVAVFGALVAVASISAFAWARRQLPDAAPARIVALSAPVAVGFDAHAVPTVRAATLEDALRAQGYLVARERMFQLELERRAAEGSLSEVVGEAALPLDKLHRTYGFRAIADAAVQLLPSDERAQVDAYAAGVNAFLEEHPHRAGLELEILGITPRPWTAADSILVLLLMYEDLSSSWQDELRAESLARLPLAERRFLMPQVTAEDVLVVPDAEPKPLPDAQAFFAEAHALLAPLRIPPDTLGLPSWAGRREAGVGSNNWVIGPSRSKSGKALLANDPHLHLSAPGTWYEMRLSFGAHTVEGVTLVGIPGISIGRTERVAWGFTNLGTDVQDLYREAATSERVESIAVKGKPPVELRVPIGRHGPQVRPGYSLAWVALDPRNIRLPMGALMSVVDWKTFNDAVDGFLGPAQNIVYADVDGHIGWRASGLVPIRREGDDGLRVHDGADPREDWRGYVPMSEMPRVYDPPAGFIVTANQRVIGTSFPHPVANDWGAPNRARRITERIEAAGKLDRETMEELQLDVVSPFHRELMALLAGLLPDLASFESWDGAASAESTQFTQARAWELGLEEALRARVLGESQAVEESPWHNEQSALLAMLREDEAAWQRAGLGAKASLLADARARAQKWLARKPARTWGERNALAVQHPFGHAGVLGWLFNPPGFAQSGASNVVRAAGREFGQSMRFLVDWADPAAATLVLPLGQSGHLGDPHRLDQQELWRAGDPGGGRTRLEQPSIGEPLMLHP